jgi:hypothetical protein
MMYVHGSVHARQPRNQQATPAMHILPWSAEVIPAGHVGQPDYFISHKWDSSFDHLVASIREYLSGAVSGTGVFIAWGMTLYGQPAGR